VGSRRNSPKALLSASGQEPPIDEEPPDESLPGVKHLKQIQRRLPTDKIVELVQQYEAGASAAELAKIFGIDQSKRPALARIKVREVNSPASDEGPVTRKGDVHARVERKQGTDLG